MGAYLSCSLSMTRSKASNLTPDLHTFPNRGDGSNGSRPPPYSTTANPSTPLGSEDRVPFYHNNSGYGTSPSFIPKPSSSTSIQTSLNVYILKDRHEWMKVLLFATLFLSAGYLVSVYRHAAAETALDGRILDWEVGEVHRQADLEYWKLEHQRFEEDRQRFKEEEERRLKELTWAGLSGDRTCLKYGTRQYQAALSHTPLGLGECYKKPIEIHGKQVLPDYCDVQGPCGHVVGHWDISFDEGSCTPWWSSISDKGCDRGTRKHRYEAKLMNLHSYDHWEALCTSTPAVIEGVAYEGATSCFSLVWGKYGVWLVDDSRCI